MLLRHTYSSTYSPLDLRTLDDQNEFPTSGVRGRRRPHARPAFRVYEQSRPPPNARLVDVDGETKAGAQVVAVYDHHRTGEPVSMDVVPDVAPDLRGHELATRRLDGDYLIAAALLYRGGKGGLEDRTRRILRSASEWCDLLMTTETDPEVREVGLLLERYLHRTRRELLVAFTDSDFGQSLAASVLAKRLLAAIHANALERLQDREYLITRAQEQHRWRDLVRTNDDLLAVVHVSEEDRFDPFDIMELVRGKLHVSVSRIEVTGSAMSRYRYSVSLKPELTGQFDLRRLLALLNQLDPSIREQRSAPEETLERWGGREVVIGSPQRIYSALQPEELESLLRFHFCDCRIGRSDDHD